MTDFLKIAKSIVVHFAHICAYGVETVNNKIIQHSFFHFHIGLLYRCHYAALYVLAASNQDVVHPFSL